MTESSEKPVEAAALLPSEGEREFRFIAQNLSITNDNEKHTRDVYVRMVLGARLPDVGKDAAPFKLVLSHLCHQLF
jgi:hypothetical protein